MVLGLNLEYTEKLIVEKGVMRPKIMDWGLACDRYVMGYLELRQCIVSLELTLEITCSVFALENLV